MTNLQVLDIMYQAFQLALRLSMPFLLVSMAVGVLIAIFQAATQINEQTMTFVPKLLAILAMMGILGSSILAMLQDFTRQGVCHESRRLTGNAHLIFPDCHAHERGHCP